MQRPRCARCDRRHIACYGYQQETEFIFRDEREKARSASQRARTQLGQRRTRIIDGVSVGESQCPDPVAFLKHRLWLTKASLPRTLSSPLEERASCALFFDWTMNPSNEGISPGYMDLIRPFYNAQPPGSLLRVAVEALAFANIQSLTVTNCDFACLARIKYGESLMLLRSAIRFKGFQLEDHELAAVFVVDIFEVSLVTNGCTCENLLTCPLADISAP